MHQKSIHSLQWTPNGTSLVTGSLDNTVCLWDLNMGKVRQQWATHQSESRLLSAIQNREAEKKAGLQTRRRRWRSRCSTTARL